MAELKKTNTEPLAAAVNWPGLAALIGRCVDEVKTVELQRGGPHLEAATAAPATASPVSSTANRRSEERDARHCRDGCPFCPASRGKSTGAASVPSPSATLADGCRAS